MEDTIELRLRWRRTWPDQPDDFVAYTDEQNGPIGRIVLGAGGNWASHDKWSWYYQAMLPGLPWAELTRGGMEASAHEAAARIEATWFRAISNR